MLVVGVLVFALQSVARQQNLHAHRIAYGQSCEDIARSGLTVLSTRFRETFRRSGKILPLLGALGNTRLGFFVASRPEQITARFAGLGADSDAIFKSLLGPDYRFPLDQMLERIPGAKCELTISITGKPLYENAGVEDPVEKTCDLVLTARATYLDVTRRVSTGFVIKVVNPSPPLTSKFTLFTPDAAAEWNTVDNDKEGRLTGSGRPAVLFNTPLEDQADGLDDRSLVQRHADAATVRAALTNRGQIYLGTRGTPLMLNLTAGRAYFGEFFHLYSPDRVSSAQLYTKLFDPPAFFNAWRATGFGHEKRYENAEYFQFPNLSQIHYGFDTTLAGDPVLGESLTSGGRSSALHLFGSADMPSRTAVWGEVDQAVCKITRVGMEAESKAAPGTIQSAPTKTYTQVPYLPFCPSAEAYASDLAAEQSGSRPRYLADIRNEFGAGSGAAPAFAMDPAVYNHARMFGSTYTDGKGPARSGYTGFMSRVERYPFGELADAMLYPTFFPPSSAPAGTFESVLELPYAQYRDVKHVELGYSDGLHRSLGQQKYFAGDMATFFTAQAAVPAPVETILRARTLREFDSQAEFFAACEWPPGSRHLEIWDCVRILEGGLDLDGWTYRGMGQVVVDRGDIASARLIARPLPDGLPSLVTFATLAGNLRFAGGEAHEAYWLAPQGGLSVQGPTDARVTGSLALGRLDPEMLGPGLVVNFTSHADPTRADDPRTARYVDYYMVGMGQLPVSVERLP